MEYEDLLKEFLDSTEVLTETNINRITRGHDSYAMISASRQDIGNNPTETWNLNNQRFNELKRLVWDKKLSYTPVFGGYKETNSNKASVEKALIVYPYNRAEPVDFNEFEKFIISLGKKFNQDTVLIKRPDDYPTYYDCRTNSWLTPFKSVDINDVQKSFFTSLKGWSDISKNKRAEWKGKPQRFTYVETYIDKEPINIMGRHAKYHVREID